MFLTIAPVFVSSKFVNDGPVSSIPILLFIKSIFFLIPPTVSVILYQDFNSDSDGLPMAFAIQSIINLGSLISLFFFLHLISVLNKCGRLNLCMGVVNAKSIKRISLFLISLSVLSLLSLMLLTTGVFEWIFNIRESYQFSRKGYGFLYALSVNLLSVAFFLNLLSKKILKFRHLIIFLPLLVLFGSKGMLIFFALGFFLMYFIKPGKINLFFIIISIVLLFYLFLAFLTRNSVDLNWFISYFDAYENATLYYDAYLSGKIDLFYGEGFISSFYHNIPRLFYEDKPFVYGHLLVNEFFYPGAAEAGHTPSFSGGVKSFYDFGWFFVLFVFLDLDMFLLALSIIFYNYFLRYKYSSYFPVLPLLMILPMFSPQFGKYLTVPLSVMFFLFISFLLYVNRSSARVFSIQK